MFDKTAADVSGCMIIFVVVIVIIRCKIINKQLMLKLLFSFLNNQVSINLCRSLWPRSLKAWVCGPYLSGFVGSKLEGCVNIIFCDCFFFCRVRFSATGRSSAIEVLPFICVWVFSRNLNNEGAYTHDGRRAMKNVQFFNICESDLSLYESSDWEESQALVLLFYSDWLRQLLRTQQGIRIGIWETYW